MKFREDQRSITSQTRSTAYAVMQRIFDEGFATGDGSVAAELCSPDLVDHQFGAAGPGADAIAHVKDAMRDVHRAFPDIKFTIEDAVESVPDHLVVIHQHDADLVHVSRRPF